MLAYTPGARVSQAAPESSLVVAKKSRRTSSKAARERAPFPGCCSDVLEKILSVMVHNHEGLSVIKLSMVNKWFRKEIGANVKVWHQLYKHWRGPISVPNRLPAHGLYGQTGNFVRLRPTQPRNMPNFKDKPPRIQMLLDLDKMPSDEDPIHRRYAMDQYKKITILRCVNRCGMCGTTRHATRPFWSLDMRVCKYCVQANLVSSKVLFERFWVDLARPVQGHPSFVDAIMGRVFYFECRTTPTQRMVFTVDPADFPGGTRSTWFFWRPHLAEALDMEQLARDAAAKQVASGLIKSAVRRALLQRLIRGPKGKRITCDRRSLLFKIRKSQLLDRMDWYNDQRMVNRLNATLNTRLRGWEDKILPCLGPDV